MHAVLQVCFPNFELDVSHTFAAEGITGLFGQSGSGKTTLLRALAGLERNARGTIRLGDTIWLDSRSGINQAAHTRRVAYVFQDVRLFAHLDVSANLRYAMKRAHGDRHARPAFDDVVDALDLHPLLGRRTDALSGGEKQRVAIARAVLSAPQLLLFDEPLAALDVRRKAEILPYISNLSRRFNLPGIYVSHALDEISALADQLLVLSAGKVAAHGPVAEVLERLDLGPLLGRFEAGVVLNATVDSHDHGYVLTTLACGQHLLSVPALDAAIGTGVRVRIRARDVAIARVKPEQVSIRNVLAGAVSEVREETDTAYAEILVDVGEAQLRARLTRRSAVELGLAPGVEVFALIKSVALERAAAELPAISDMDVGTLAGRK
jgi:molybdate transport system ATP-binding protein